MIDAVIGWALRNRTVVLLAAAGLVIWGGLRAQQMPVDVFPDLSAPTVTLVAEAHGMAPDETERLVTLPLESALAGATGVRRVRSATSVGVAVVWVEFDWGADIYTARQIVAEKLDLVVPNLPPGIEPPVLAPISSIMGEVLFIGLTGDGVSPRSLRTLADWQVRRRLLAIPGVAQVVPIGGEVRQLQVRLRPADLFAHGVDVDAVVRAVQAANRNVSAGFAVHGGQQTLVYGLGRLQDASQLANAVVADRPAAPVRVMDVADVVVGSAVRVGTGGVNGQPGVVLGLQKQPGVNTLALSAQIDETLDQIQDGLPEGVRLARGLLRQADFIQSAVDNVSLALRDGALLVVLIVGLFLLSGRATLITALAIPLSLVVAVLVLDALGASLDTMTLGGMAIAVGALVDDAIIDVENVVRRLREHEGPVDVGAVVFSASKEIRGSIVFATLVIALVFLPLFFLHGVEGRLLAPLGLAYIVALAASLGVALTVTPVLCALLLPNSRAVRSGVEPRLIQHLRRGYEWVLGWTLTRWPALVAVSLVGVVGAGLALSRAGRTFLPEFNEGALTIGLVSPAGTSLAEATRIGAQAEALIRRHPEVVSTARRTGRAELDAHAQAAHASELEVRLAPGGRGEGALLAALRADLAGLPGTQAVIGQPISHRIDHMVSGTRASIALKVFGPDHAELRRLAELAKAQMAQVPGVVDLAVEAQAHLPLTAVRFDRDALAGYGLQVGQAADVLRTALYGLPVSRILDGEAAYDVVVRYGDPQADPATLGQAPLLTPGGGWVPLEAVAELRRDVGPNQISREQGQRKVVVMANVGDGHDLGSVVDGIRARVGAQVPLPPGYRVAYHGQFESAQAATRTLGLLSVVVLLGILLLLYLALRSGRDASLVMVNLPLALIGGVAGVYLAGGVVSVASLIGFIALFGIATRNGIMLVTHIRHLVVVEGVADVQQAARRGASERLAPILMTALASGLGLLPLARAAGEPGAEIQAPMALVILAGLATSTVLNMLVVPALVLRFGSVRRLAQAPVVAGL